MLVEPGRKPLDVRGSAVAVADRVDLEHVLRDAESAQQLGIELDHLRIDRGIIAPDRLDRELPVLAVPALLRTVVPPHRPDRVQLLRLRLPVQPVLEVRAADRRRRLGTESQRPRAAVREGVRLLLHDVGAPAGRADDQLGVLEAGRVDAPIAVQGAHLLHLPRHPLPDRLVGREDVVRAARRLEARHARSSARNGFRASSAPSVVVGPWPG